jgi:NitT/TauT family transport system ATP-binding protein
VTVRRGFGESTMRAESAGVLDIRNAQIAFTSRRDRVRHVAVQDVSFRIEPNEFVSIVGPSGCGKSSLMLAAAGLIPLAKGSISVSGRRVTKPGGRESGLVFQAPTLLPWRSILSNVSYGLEIMKVDRPAARRTAKEMLDLVGLTCHEAKYPHELSGGMQQRVNLARALAVDPQVLLMDEPFAALDAQTREVMQRELLRIWAEMRKSVMFVTHQIDEAIFLGDRVIVLSHGPGSTVAKEIAVDFPRPRTDDLKRSPEFLAIVDDIWATISS